VRPTPGFDSFSVDTFFAPPVSFPPVLKGNLPHLEDWGFDPVSTWLVYGPGSDEYQMSVANSQMRYRNTVRRWNSFMNDYEKYFLLYDKYDPYAY